MAETKYGSRPAADETTSRKLEQADLEVLRLRDLLIGKDAELGALRGRLAELEEREARMLNAIRRITRLPVLVRMATRTLLALGKRRNRPDG
jgi:hypothetical protein